MADITGEDISAWRIRLSIPKAVLAKRAGIDRGTLAGIEDGTGPTEHRDTTIQKIVAALEESERKKKVEPPAPVVPEDEPAPGLVRFVVRGVYGAEALVVEGPMESIEELERSVDRIMRRMQGNRDV